MDNFNTESMQILAQGLDVILFSNIEQDYQLTKGVKIWAFTRLITKLWKHL